MYNLHFLWAVNSETVITALKPVQKKKKKITRSFKINVSPPRSRYNFFTNELVFNLLLLGTQQQTELNMLARGLVKLIKHSMNLISSVRE
jgi:hypothetical protein